MKIKFLGSVLFLFFLMIVLQSVSGGRAAVGGQDRTGSPGSVGNCTACHANSGAFSNPQLAITVKNMMGTAVTSYSPEDTFMLEFRVTSGGNPAGYGMQAVVLNGSNMNTGDLINPSSANTQLSTIGNGREFIEHQGRSATGVFTCQWIAPMAGTGDVRIYGLGMAVNGANTSGDNTSPTNQLLLTESPFNSTENLRSEHNLFKIYPIPNRGTFTLENTGTNAATGIQLFDATGKLVYTKRTAINGQEKEQISIPNLSQGLYTVAIETEGERTTQQMLVIE